MSAAAVDAADAARRAVWQSMSDLYLDAPFRDTVRRAAHSLATSPYSLDELRAILFDEVHPVVCANLCTSVGVWEGFDQAWLTDRIRRNRCMPIWRRPHGRCTRRYAVLMWRLLEPRIVRARHGSTKT